jgi:hypothetical protein
LIQITVSLEPTLPKKILEQLQADPEVIAYLSQVSAELTKEFTMKGQLAIHSHLGKKLIDSHRLLETPDEPEQIECDSTPEVEKQSPKRSRKRTANQDKVS